MKFILLTLALCLWAAQSMAETPEINASKVTCQELENFVEQYKDVTVVYKGLFKTKRTNVYIEEGDCNYDEKEMVWGFKTSDVKNCVVGKWCKRRFRIEIDVSPSPSGGSVFGPGFGGFFGGSRPSNNPPSTYTPPSSGSRGPSYNPPSRGSGSNYNPPSSGSNRGPRYCPTCR